MKDHDQGYSLLRMFQEHPGQFLSGEEISRRLSISRTAVWKQINKLRSLGYEFEALPRLGYRMVDEPDVLDEQLLGAGMKSRYFGKQIKLLDRTISTQEDARELAEAGAPEGTLIISEEQTGGRGRMGRKFHSPRGKGIWMSLILRPKQPLHLTQQLTLLTGWRYAAQSENQRVCRHKSSGLTIFYMKARRFAAFCWNPPRRTGGSVIA